MKKEIVLKFTQEEAKILVDTLQGGVNLVNATAVIFAKKDIKVKAIEDAHTILYSVKKQIVNKQTTKTK
jgi:hypothetical protein